MLKITDIYKITSMFFIVGLELIVLFLVCMKVSGLYPIALLSIFTELIRFVLAVKSLEMLATTGEIKPLLEIIDRLLFWFNSFLVTIAVIVAIVFHFLGY